MKGTDNHERIKSIVIVQFLFVFNEFVVLNALVLMLVATEAGLSRQWRGILLLTVNVL